MTEKNYEKYLKLYEIKRDERERYTHKEYNKRLTEKDKKIAESKFTYRAKNILTEKHGYLLIIMFIILMIFIDSSMDNPSTMLVVGYSFLFMLLLIAFMYKPKKIFYLVFLILFIIIFLLTKRFNFINIAELQASKNNANIKKKN